MYRGSYIRTADGTVRPTLAGLLALGTYPQQFFPQLSITFTHYRGTTKASDAAGIRYTDTLTIEGPIPLLIEEATRKVQEASPRGAIMRGAFRYDLFGFPPVAVREAITNAVMQRDLLPPPEVRNSLIRFALLFYKRGETEHTTLTKHTESSAHAHSIAHSTNSKPAANTSTREAIVDYLRAHDPASTKELADAAGVTAENYPAQSPPVTNRKSCEHYSPTAEPETALPIGAAGVRVGVQLTKLRATLTA
ncbi:hypothetical protein [Corynebacterium pseudodiphtheriticum]|uniref:hypothetical protein n=1 Tax=Corynebacterium pseudodiphtheriticum TaxID=37637 RepID=UPI00254385BF|nr:hypothetical protein [Corynebacterium pseudodiphtheriticum]MDK4206638.1 hypothetical protein [Corynebacterium pseudodiphtheriticum]MDK4284604.1 hypothetical protein [Corynebacterium pseudodiphtheriticum]MDK8397090.1 hypothetical protein [Corynebacterium pseudodiphtheriticum]